MLSDEAKALGVQFDGEKFTVQHGDLRYRYAKVEDALKYARDLHKRGIPVLRTAELAEEEAAMESAGEEQAVRERLEGDRRRRVEEETRRQIESLDPLESAKIARQVTIGFDSTEILDLLNFFESTSQLYEAVKGSHSKLEPEYRKAIMAWYADNTELQADLLSESIVQEVVTRTINQGLSAICKSEALNVHLGVHRAMTESQSSHGAGQVLKIEKVRSWKELSADSD